MLRQCRILRCAMSQVKSKDSALIGLPKTWPFFTYFSCSSEDVFAFVNRLTWGESADKSLGLFFRCSRCSRCASPDAFNSTAKNKHKFTRNAFSLQTSQNKPSTSLVNPQINFLKNQINSNVKHISIESIQMNWIKRQKKTTSAKVKKIVRWWRLVRCVRSGVKQKKKIDAGGGAGGAGGAGGGQPPRARQGGRVGGYREVGGAQAAI